MKKGSKAAKAWGAKMRRLRGKPRTTKKRKKSKSTRKGQRRKTARRVLKRRVSRRKKTDSAWNF